MNATYSKRQADKIISVVGKGLIPIDTYSYKINVKPVNEVKDEYSLSVELICSNPAIKNDPNFLTSIKNKIVETINNIEFN